MINEIKTNLNRKMVDFGVLDTERFRSMKNILGSEGRGEG